MESIGQTMTQAVSDVEAITRILDSAGIPTEAQGKPMSLPTRVIWLLSQAQLDEHRVGKLLAHIHQLQEALGGRGPFPPPIETGRS